MDLKKHVQAMLFLTLLSLIISIVGSVNATEIDNTNQLTDVNTISTDINSIELNSEKNTSNTLKSIEPNQSDYGNNQDNSPNEFYSRSYLENSEPTDTTLQTTNSNFLIQDDVSTGSVMTSESNFIIFKQTPMDILYISPTGTSSSYGTVNDPMDWDTAYGHINENGIIYFLNGTYTNIVNKTINRNLTISAYNNANVILDANKMGYTFYVSNENVYLNVIGLHFINGTGCFHSSKNRGGAILSLGLLNIYNSTFENNNAQYGGAIYCYNETKIDNSVFSNNTAYIGGSIYSERTLNISNSNFINNSAELNGGAIYILDNSNIIKSSFIDNKAYTGGAIQTYGGLPNLTVNSSVFYNNSAETIWFTGYSLNINYNWWGNNTPNSNLIYNAGSFMVPTNWVLLSVSNNGSSISANFKKYSNGMASYDLPEDIILPVRGVTYTEGLVSPNPGDTLTSSVYTDYSPHDVNVTVDNQTITLINMQYGDLPNIIYVNNSYTGYSTGTQNQPFKNVKDAINLANYAGSGNVTVYVASGKYSDVNMTINNNILLISQGDVILDAENKGYFFICDNPDLYLSINGFSFFNGTGYRNISTIIGGAIYSSGNLIINNSYFQNNHANYGGAIYSTGNCTIYSSVFSDNHVTPESGGAIYSSGELNVFNSFFYDNTASNLGGAICSLGKNNFDSSTFMTNTADAGGAIYTQKTANITACGFSSNVGDNAGAIFSDWGCDIKYSSFTSNSAKVGGSIYSTNDYCKINNSTFEQNHVTLYGGAIYALSRLEINNTNFTFNQADSAGGAIYTRSYANITSSFFLNNSAINPDSLGGALYLLNTNINVNVSSSVFINNTANRGSAIYIYNGLSKFLDYNWWGNNTPFDGDNYNNLIAYNSFENFTSINYIITNLTSNPTIINPNSSALLNVKFLSYNNLTGETSELPSFMNLPNRIVKLNAPTGYFNTNIISFNNNTNAYYTAPKSEGNVTITSIIDNQTLNIVLTVKNQNSNGSTNNTTSLIPTSISNTALNSPINGTVTVNVISDGTIVYTGNVNLFYNNKAISTGVVKNGACILNLTGLNSGTYLVNAFYFGKNPFDSCSKLLNLTIYDNRSYLVAYDFNETYGEHKNFTGKLYDSNGNPIIGKHIALNLTRLSDNKSKIYWVNTDTLGEYFLEINLSPGNYTGYASFSGDDYYSESNSNLTNIKIYMPNNTKIQTVLIANMFNHTYGAGLNFTGKLLNLNNTPVIGQHIRLNLTRISNSLSKIYWVTTDTNGEYQLAINLGIGEYTVQCSYDGTSKYETSSTNTTIIVT